MAKSGELSLYKQRQQYMMAIEMLWYKTGKAAWFKLGSFVYITRVQKCPCTLRL